MSFWEEVKNKVVAHTTSSDISVNLYKKIAPTGANELAVIRPTFYLGQVGTLTMDYIDFVEKFLKVKEKDWSNYLKLILYIRETSRSLASNIKEIAEPLETLIQILEELFEGDEFEAIDDDEEEEAEEEGEEKKAPAKPEPEPEPEPEAAAAREDLTTDRDALEESLRVKFREAQFSQAVVDGLAGRMADVYLECVQFAKELSRLDRAPEGDLATILSILVDLQYGLDFQLRALLLEDIFIDETPTFVPGIMTWISHFIQEITEMISSEPGAAQAAEAGEKEGQ